MFETLENIDRSLFLKLNGFHNETLDAVIPVLTSFPTWTPLFLLVLFFLVRKYKKRSFLFLLVIPLMIVCSDQGSNLVKKSVKRYRPTHNTEIDMQVHTVNGYKGGQYGFVSGHAANSFAVAIMVILLLPTMSKWLKLVCIVWALLVCYTRIYLGVHYPSDLFVGACIGVASAFLMHRLFLILDKKMFSSLT
ncbi:MAG TPA: phosphatase PAP2 family protein [Bacteroidia bacterium]|nr:phosphatase PAP2 family protein [Bacteroidia bacterium]